MEWKVVRPGWVAYMYFLNYQIGLSIWHLPSFGFDAISPFPLDAVSFKTLQSFTSLMLISSSAISPKGESPRTATNDTFQNKQCTIREVLKWLSKVNYSIVIATLSDWLKNLVPEFQPMKSKTKTNRTLYAQFFPRFKQVTGNC